MGEEREGRLLLSFREEKNESGRVHIDFQYLSKVWGHQKKVVQGAF